MLERKPGNPLSDFSHDCIGNDLLCLAVLPYRFSILKSYTDNCCHIESQSIKQILPCLQQCRLLYFGNNGCKFFVCYLLRNCPEFLTVFGGSAAVSVLCAPPPDIATFSIFAICTAATKIHYHFLFLQYSVRGVWFWEMAVLPPFFCLLPDHNAPRIKFANFE